MNKPPIVIKDEYVVGDVKSKFHLSVEASEHKGQGHKFKVKNLDLEWSWLKITKSRLSL